jgi:putative DNA primase/helicase
MANRGRLLAAALTVLRAFVVAGRPAHGKALFGSFEAWDRLVRGSLLWLGAEDPCGTRQRVREESDADRDGIRALHAAWRVAFGADAATIAEAIKAAMTNEVLRDALRAQVPRRREAKGDALDAHAVGNAIRKVRNRIIEGWVLRKAGERNGSATYRVEESSPPESPPDSGDSGTSGTWFDSNAGARTHTRARGAPNKSPKSSESPSLHTEGA